MWKSKMCWVKRHPMALPSSPSSFQARWSAYLGHPRQIFVWPVLKNSWLTSLHKSSVYRLWLLCFIARAEKTQTPIKSFDVLEDFLFPYQHFLVSIKQTQHFELSKSKLIVIIWNLLLSSKHHIIFKGGVYGKCCDTSKYNVSAIMFHAKGNRNSASIHSNRICLPSSFGSKPTCANMYKHEDSVICRKCRSFNKTGSICFKMSRRLFAWS